MKLVDENRIHITNAAQFGRVAVMLGGDSSEREVSLDSGNAVLDALKKRGVNATAWDPAEQPLEKFVAAGFDRVWIALHGPGGEDGALQGVLQWMNMAYTGSGVLASALAMDKIKSKQLFEQADVFEQAHRLVDKHQQRAEAIADEVQPEELRRLFYYLVDTVLERPTESSRTTQPPNVLTELTLPKA